MKDLIKKILIEETEDKDLIVPYRLEDRKERYKRIVYKRIQDYIKNGSNGRLDLWGAPIETLPSNLKTVGGVLYLNDSKILELPEGLTVGDSLFFSRTKINNIPKGLKVEGNLWLTDSSLSEKYNKDQIRKMIEDSGGYVHGVIYSYLSI